MAVLFFFRRETNEDKPQRSTVHAASGAVAALFFAGGPGNQWDRWWGQCCLWGLRPQWARYYLYLFCHA